MSGSNSSILPPRAVFEAFGALETPERLAGGRGLTWRAGKIVVRPTADLEEAAWKSQVLAEIDGSEGRSPASGHRLGTVLVTARIRGSNRCSRRRVLARVLARRTS